MVYIGLRRDYAWACYKLLVPGGESAFAAAAAAATAAAGGPRYDGKSPAAYWFGLAASEQPSDIKAGQQLTTEVEPAANGDKTLTVKLPPGASWDNINVISFGDKVRRPAGIISI
jgi:hypothetical protein